MGKNRRCILIVLALCSYRPTDISIHNALKGKKISINKFKNYIIIKV